MRRWLYYTYLALLDLWRLWPTVQHHVIIVAGICVPILILLALKRGHVENLRKSLVTSPTGREIIVYGEKNVELMTESTMLEMEGEIPGVDLIFPATERVGDLSRSDGVNIINARNVTFHATRSGDPVLKHGGFDVLEKGEHATVLGRKVAAALGVKEGDRVKLTVSRAGGDRASIDLLIKAIKDTSDSNIGYLDYKLLDWIEQYVQGYMVKELNWPAGVLARDSYSGYIIVCKKTDPLREGDINVFKERGYEFEEQKDFDVRTLYGLLRPEAAEKLTVYLMFRADSLTNPHRRLDLRASEIENLTAADDIVIPWTAPRVYSVEGKPHRLIGVSLLPEKWLPSYMVHPDAYFEYEEGEFTICFPNGSAGQQKQDVAMSIGGTQIKLRKKELVEVDQKKSGKQGPQALAIVPINLLAHLDGLSHGVCEFDANLKRFVPVPREIDYTKWKLYAKTIDDVLEVEDVLERRGFVVRGHETQIREIQNQDQSLQLLVAIVALGVFGFGFITVTSVLLDSTNRKRGTIGILRVMGVSRFGVMWLVLVRSVIIGILAGAVTVVFGFLLCEFLSWHPEANWIASWKPIAISMIYPMDMFLVFSGSLICCIGGSLYPAWKASRLDPFDAIIEGRFH